MSRRRPAAATLVNLALAPFAGGRRRPEAAWRKAADAAAARAGRPLGDDRAFADEQGFLLSCLAAAGGVTPLGWTAAATEAKTRLENRLRISALVEAHPEIPDGEIRRPVFVVGLPRTATTLAHKVLALAPGHRAPLMWEMLHTGVETDPAAVERLVRARSRQVALTPRIAPGWEVMHPVGADQPEESLFVLPHGHYYRVLRGELPGYRAWLDARDTVPDYEYLKLALQVLQYGREPRRWILKYPAHLGDVDAIREVFPDAVFVWTHRDPATAAGSMCSLMETSWGIYRERVDPEAVGRIALGEMARIVERGMAARAALPPESIVDVPYAMLAEDPHAAVPRIYEAIGADWTDADAANLGSALARPTTARHEYALDRYGLDPDRITEALGDYPELPASLEALGLVGLRVRLVVSALAAQGLHEDHADDDDHEQAEQDRGQGRAGVRLLVIAVAVGGGRGRRRGLGIRRLGRLARRSLLQSGRL
ncbi:sulfotransferase [Glycomyces paridis]|uniref:Sulfotransferase n=1 Tax=Glycomyces paridis TaxID=2126555 RepID=A0A4S8PN70_9ACTN|nr:sulfotransferase [Glycomyces paridis]